MRSPGLNLGLKHAPLRNSPLKNFCYHPRKTLEWENESPKIRIRRKKKKRKKEKNQPRGVAGKYPDEDTLTLP